MHLSRLGSAAYGTVTVAVDGAIPAALSGQVAGAEFGPSWLDSNGPRIAYQSGGTGSGPWILQSYNVNTAATATLSGSGQNFMAAGGGHWLAYLAGAGPGFGVRSDVTIANPNAPLAGSSACDVSPDGELVICDYQQTATGISVYNSSGTNIFHLAAVVLASGPVRLVDDILAFQSVNTYTYNGVTYGPGWHLINIATGAVPTWLPRIDGVNWLIPCTDTDGTLFLVERAESVSIREAARSTGYTLTGSTGLGFNPDGIPYTAGVIRAGFCTDLGESVSSVVLWDVTMATGAASKGVVSGGTIVFSAQPTLEAVQFTVGPAEGSGTTTIPAPPIDHAVTKFIPSPQAGQSVQRMTQEWQAWAQRLRGGVLAVANTASKSVTPTPLQTPAFGVIAGDVTPSIVATTAGDTLSLTDTDTTIGFTSNPATKTLDLRVVPQGPDTAIQFNDAAVLAGSAQFTSDPATGQFAVTEDGAEAGVLAQAATIHTGSVMLHPADHDVIVNAIPDASDNYIATTATVVDLGVDAAGNAFVELQEGQTPGVAVPFTTGKGVRVTPSSAMPKWAVEAYQYGGLGTGQPGMTVFVNRNTSGGGAASTIGLEQKDGTDKFIWFRTSDGLPVYGTSRPVEGGAETGTPFGNTTATYLTATDETTDLPNSRELVAGTDITFDDTTPGQRIISASTGGSGGGWIEGLMRTVGDGATVAFALPDVAESLLFASVAGAVADPLTYTLTGSEDEITFDVAPGAGDVVTVNYVTASA